MRRRARERAAIPWVQGPKTAPQPTEERPKPTLVEVPPQLKTAEEEVEERHERRRAYEQWLRLRQAYELAFDIALAAALPQFSKHYFPHMRLSRSEAGRLLHYLRLAAPSIDIVGSPTIHECFTAFCHALGFPKNQHHVA